MRLIAMLICLAIVVLTPFQNKLFDCSCSNYYLKLVQSKVKLPNTWLMIGAFLLPPLLVFLLFYYLVDDWAYGLIGLVIDVVVLLFCLGTYKISEEQQNISDIFAFANENIFAILVWFILLGPFGALTYRYITSTRRLTETDGEHFGAYADHIQFIHAILDWLPIRITALIYALAGDFMGTFRHWFKHVARGIESNHELIMQSGMMALKQDPCTELPNTVDIREETQQLINTAVIICLVIVAVFTLGSWIA